MTQKIVKLLIDFPSIKEKINEQQNSDHDFINKFEAIAQYNENAKDVFADYEKQLSEAKGTDNYEQIRDEITAQAGEYIKSIINVQADLTAEKFLKTMKLLKQLKKLLLNII